MLISNNTQWQTWRISHMPRSQSLFSKEVLFIWIFWYKHATSTCPKRTHLTNLLRTIRLPTTFILHNPSHNGYREKLGMAMIPRVLYVIINIISGYTFLDASNSQTKIWSLFSVISHAALPIVKFSLNRVQASLAYSSSVFLWVEVYRG